MSADVDNINNNIEKYGQTKATEEIYVMTIVGEIEGHDSLSGGNKSTKYEHLLPILANIEADESIKGILILVNTMGGDVSAGLALSEMIATLSKPTVSLIIGEAHSIGVTVALAADYCYIAKTGTVLLHPVRMNGTVIGAPQTFEYLKMIQDRIIGFISRKRGLKKKKLEKMMYKTGILTKDLGTILVGSEAVREGLVDETGGINKAMSKLKSLIKD